MATTLHSRFMQKTLMADEVLIREGQFARLYTVTCYFVLSAFTLAGFSLQYGLWHYMPEMLYADFHAHFDRRIPVAAGFFLGLWQFFWMMLKKWSTEIVLTDQRLIYKRGFFNIKVDEVDIEQLASDNVAQSFIGRLFDYGVLHIRCIEASDIFLPPIAQPYEFRNAIEQQKHRYREEYMKSTRLRQHGMNPGDV